MMGETKTQNCTKHKKGDTQIVIGIIASILLFFITVRGELLKLHLDYQISHDVALLTDEALLTALGYKPPIVFQKSPTYWIGRLTFHIFGIVAILVYMTSVGSVRIKSAKVSFILCLIYFLTQAYGNITNLSYEEQVRGFTFGGWVANTIVWIPKYAIELGLLVQGLLGVRKRISNGGHGFLRSLVGKKVIEEKSQPKKSKNIRINCPECGRSLKGATQEMIGDIGVCPKCKSEFTIEPKDEQTNK